MFIPSDGANVKKRMHYSWHYQKPEAPISPPHTPTPNVFICKLLYILYLHFVYIYFANVFWTLGRLGVIPSDGIRMVGGKNKKKVCARYSWHCDKRDAPISSPQCKFYMFCVYILYTISLLIFMLDFGVT